MDGGPADIKDGGEDKIPGILATNAAEKVEAEEDAEEGRGYQEATHIVPGVPLATLALDFVA